jgi:hypothetical protein
MEKGREKGEQCEEEEEDSWTLCLIEMTGSHTNLSGSKCTSKRGKSRPNCAVRRAEKRLETIQSQVEKTD